MSALIDAGKAPVTTLLIYDVARLARKRYEQVARERSLGLTRAQASVLYHLARQEGIKQAALAQIMEIEPITLVRLLDRLQERGLIERRADPADRRAYQLFVTAAAEPLLTRSSAVGAQVFEEALSGLSEAERNGLHRSLAILRANLLDRLSDGCDAAPVASTMEAVNG